MPPECAATTQVGLIDLILAPVIATLSWVYALVIVPIHSALLLAQINATLAQATKALAESAGDCLSQLAALLALGVVGALVAFGILLAAGQLLWAGVVWTTRRLFPRQSE